MFLIDFTKFNQEDLCKCFETSRVLDYELTDEGIHFLGNKMNYLIYPSQIDPDKQMLLETIIVSRHKGTPKPASFLAVMKGDEILFSLDIIKGVLHIKRIDKDVIGVSSHSIPIRVLEEDTPTHISIYFKTDDAGLYIYVFVDHTMEYNGTLQPAFDCEDHLRVYFGKLKYNNSSNVYFRMLKLCEGSEENENVSEVFDKIICGSDKKQGELTRFILDTKVYTIIRNSKSTIGQNWMILNGEIYRISEFF